MKYTNWKQIPKFTRTPTYAVDVAWHEVPKTLAGWEADLNPDFQRGHVWTREQQVRFVEFCFRGGDSGRNVFLNAPRFRLGYRDGMVLVDGKQRVEAWAAFYRNEFALFGDTYSSDLGQLPYTEHWACARLHVNDLKTRAEVLTWYLEMNSGGTPHAESELNRVKSLLVGEAS